MFITTFEMGHPKGGVSKVKVVYRAVSWPQRGFLAQFSKPQTLRVWNTGSDRSYRLMSLYITPVGYNSVADRRVYNHSFSRCCLPNVRNRAKYQENSNL